MAKTRNRTLPLKFFGRPTLTVAEELLGKFLVRKFRKKTISAMITEVESYIGSADKASHASKGKTERTKIMFGKAGYWYVYLIYGMHYCLNIVTEEKNYPAAILIRAVLVDDFKKDLIRGPGKVTKFLKINKKFNGKPSLARTGLWIEDRGISIKSEQIKRGKRIGIDYAGKWKRKPWRLYI